MSSLASTEFWIFVAVIAGIYTIFALGLQVQFGFTGLANFGHVAFMAIAAYTMAILVVKDGIALWLAALIAIAVSMAFALLIGLPTLRLRADYLAITTIAFSEIIRYLAVNLQGLTGGPEGSINLLGPSQPAYYNGEWVAFQTRVQGALGHVLGGSASANSAMLVLVWAIALIVALFLYLVVNSPWGRVLKAVREDEDAAAALGKNAFSYKLQALVLGAALGAIAGLFYAFQFAFFSPGDFQPLLTFFAYVIVIMGGIGSIWGVPIGAAVFGLIFAGTRFFGFPPFSYFDASQRASLRLMIVGAIIIALMAFRPQGILGKEEELALDE